MLGRERGASNRWHVTGGGASGSAGGDDRRFGGDPLGGDAGPDRFLFAVVSARDVIIDFARGADVIDIRGYSGIAFADLDFDTTTDAGSTVIDLGLANGGAGGIDVLTVAGVVDLASGDFLFA